MGTNFTAVEFDGKVYESKNAFYRAYHKKKDTVLDRLQRGWSLEDALITPVQGHDKVKYEGKLVLVNKLAKKLGCKRRAIMNRIYKYGKDHAMDQPLRRKIKKVG